MGDDGLEGIRGSVGMSGVSTDVREEGRPQEGLCQRATTAPSAIANEFKGIRAG